ncbi:hypothetical protein ABW21_db0203893 [Orbilia brochopaga]|nr:hypothetical protein ABW21_db0203893 [Drechslerella brochopaga]
MPVFTIRRRYVRPADLMIIVLPTLTIAAPALRQRGLADAADIMNDAALWKRDNEYEDYQDDDDDKKDKDKDKDKEKDDDDDKKKKKKTTSSTTSTAYPSTYTTTQPRPTSIVGVIPGVGSVQPWPEPETPISISMPMLPPTMTPIVPPQTTSTPWTTSAVAMLPGMTALPEVTAPVKPSPVPVGNSSDHTRMEIGVACGVVGAFILIGIAIFYYMKRRRSVVGSVWTFVGGPFGRAGTRSSIEPSSRGHPEYESRTNVDAWPPKFPDPVMMGVGDNKRISNISESPSDIERFATIKRKYTISRSIELPRQVPPSELPASRRDSASSYTTMTVLPQITGSGFDDGFLNSIERTDPFADPYSPSTASIPAPLPLRIPVKPSTNGNLAPGFQPHRSVHKYRGSDETLELTDPRRKLSRNLIPAPLRIVRPGQPPAQATRNDSNAARRESGYSESESEGPARHRGVKSWVKHEANIRERYYALDEVETPLYAKSEATLYNRLSLNSGMDTRRTEYEYYMSRRP